MKRIGIIGVGLLGSAVAARLLESKFVVKGYDTRTEQVNQLQSRGLILAENVAEAAEEADAVFTILPSLESVEKTILGAGGLIETAAPKATLIQMSTISPGLTRRLANAAAAKGPGFLDAPMSGTSAMVASGDCTIFVAGDQTKVDACRPVFDAIAKKTHYVGDVGMASLAKLATNLLVGLNTAALAEALVLGERRSRSGCAYRSPQRQRGRLEDARCPRPAHGAPSLEAQMKIDLFLKDFKLMLEEGLRLGVPLPLTCVAQQLVTATAVAGRGEEDLAAIVTTLERLAGLGNDRL